VIGLDTNVIIRYITQDEPRQAKKATQLIESQLSGEVPGFITLITLVEVSWVLEACYKQSKADVLTVLEALIVTKQLLIEQSDVVYLAIKRCSLENADFSDTLIAVVSEHNGCDKVVTFDKKAKNVGMTIL
jgi:predicted nucleic-acid-binding protein